MTTPVVLTAPINTMTPIVKVVGDFCNLRCRYCFYNTNDQATRHIMDTDLLEKFISEYMALFDGYLTFIWHGGEPLLAGLPFFELIIKLQQQNLRKEQIIYNIIQTNATLVNNDWAKFFKAHNFRIGVSLDGDKESHDQFRLNHKGNGSFDNTMQGIDVLRQHSIDPGIIQTITRDNLRHTQDNFHFFINKGVGWGSNIYLDVDDVNQAMLGQNISNEELIDFLKTHINLWLAQDNPGLKIREIEDFLAGVLRKQAAGCTFNGACTAYFLVEYDGRIYPCDRLSHQDNLLFGNLKDKSLLEILNGSERLAYAQEVNSLHPDCKVCEWQFACHNGCTHHRVGGIGGKYYYCDARKTILAYLADKISQYTNAQGGDENARSTCDQGSSRTASKSAR